MKLHLSKLTTVVIILIVLHTLKLLSVVKVYALLIIAIQIKKLYVNALKYVNLTKITLSAVTTNASIKMLHVNVILIVPFQSALVQTPLFAVPVVIDALNQKNALSLVI